MELLEFPQIGRLRLVPGRRGMCSSSDRNTRLTALHSSKPIRTRLRQTSTRARAVPSRVRWADRRASSGDRRKQVREQRVAIIHLRMERGGSKRRSSPTHAASRTKSALRSAAAPTDPSQTRVCTSKSEIPGISSLDFHGSLAETTFPRRLTHTKMTPSTHRPRAEHTPAPPVSTHHRRPATTNLSAI